MNKEHYFIHRTETISTDIRLATDNLINFFEAGAEFEEMRTIRIFLGLQGEWFDELGRGGNLREKYTRSWASLSLVNTEQDLIVMFVCERGDSKTGTTYQMFCVKDGKLFQYISPLGESVISRKEFYEWQAIDMLDVAKEFVKGESIERVTESDDAMAKDLINFWRKPKSELFVV